MAIVEGLWINKLCFIFFKKVTIYVNLIKIRHSESASASQKKVVADSEHLILFDLRKEDFCKIKENTDIFRLKCVDFFSIKTMQTNSLKVIKEIRFLYI